MVDYQYIHIPKTGGTSISKVLGVYAHHEDVVDDHRFKFAFVRHPVTRFVSGFHYWKRNRELTPEEFIDNPEYAKYWENLIFRPQWKFICDLDGTVKVDFLGRFETLNSDWERLCGVIGLPYVELPWVRRGDYPQPNLNDTHLKYLYNRYKKDFEIFGYEVRDDTNRV